MAPKPSVEAPKVRVLPVNRYCLDFINEVGTIATGPIDHPYIKWRKSIEVHFESGRRGYFFEGEYEIVPA